MAGLISLLSSSLKNKLNERKQAVVLWKINPTGSTDTTSGFQFQYFPETITDTKAVNYAPREALGGNLPIYQWINGGENRSTIKDFYGAGQEDESRKMITAELSRAKPIILLDNMSNDEIKGLKPGQAYPRFP